MKHSIRLHVCFFLAFSISCFNMMAQDLKPSDWHNLVGYWKFQNAKDLTQATVGKNLSLIGKHSVVKGAAYGDTATRIAIGSYYDYEHGITPNGGGDSVNQYTLMFDFKVLSLDRWHTFYQTDSSNTNDGEFFIRPSTGSNPGKIGTAATGYSKDSIVPNQWYRLVISVNLGHYFRYYINGKLFHEGDTQDVDGRFALTPKILFFADNNQEDDTIDIASMAIFDTCLSAADIAKIGTIDPCIANPPKIDLGRDTSLCSYNSLNLGAGINYVKYQWSTGNATPFVSIGSSTLGIGEKPVWVKVIDKNGCSGSDTILVNFIAAPDVALGNDTSICKGAKITLNGGLETNHTYQWRIFPSGDFLSANYAITVDSSGSYMLKKTSAFGCIATDTVHVKVHKNPAKPTINTTGRTTFCDGNTVQLDGPKGFANYLWSDNSNQETIHVASSKVLTLQVKDSNGCISPKSDSVEIVVHPLPKIPTVQVLGDTVFCEGDSIILYTTSGFKLYTWQDGPGNAMRTVTQQGWYFVYVTDSNDCVSPGSRAIKISSLPSPKKPAIDILGKNVFCDGDSTKVSVSENFNNYTWSDSSKLKERIITQSGDYRVKVQNSSGCESPWSDEIKILVNAYPPKPAITFAPIDSLVCSSNAEHYRWFKGSTLLPDTNKSILSKGEAYYRVQAANGNCWSELSDSVYHNTLKIQTIKDNSFAIKIYPNPVQDVLTLTFEKQIVSNEIRVEIKNLLGQKVMEMNSNSNNGEAVFYLNVKDLQSGSYILQATISDEVYIRKFNKL